MSPSRRDLATEVARTHGYSAAREVARAAYRHWQGRQVRVRHDDPHLGPYTPPGAVIRGAVEPAGDVEGSRLELLTTVGGRDIGSG